MPFRAALLVVAALVLGACAELEAIAPDVDPLAQVEPSAIGDWSPEVELVGGLARFARTEGERLILRTAGGERDFQAGVNIGATVPGRFPSELAVDAVTYRRWFDQITDFGFTSIRVYTMLPPHFYSELRTHNLENPDHPLYLMHGAWPPEQQIVGGRDFYDPRVIAEFKSELTDLVAVVHGDADVPERQGRAHGVYTADVSPWLLGWAIGIEWDAVAVFASDELNAGLAPFEGTYFTATEEASPTESWMAMMLDHLAAAEAAHGVTMPLSFVNWVTTDPLDHPEEPLAREDMVGVDPMNLGPTDAWPGGYFAGYHVYPYYPDFQRYEPGVADFVHDGEIDPYAGLLSKYADHHEGVPLVILEFGVPTGMAKAHEEPLGRNQGDHSEQEQAKINAELLDTISSVGLAGGYVFAWADEWFKLTWNTKDFEPADRRALWMNAWTNEAHFGLIASEPGLAGSLLLDGDGSEWPEYSRVIHEGRGAVREVRAAGDEGFLYLRVVTDAPSAWRSNPLVIGFDVIAGHGVGLDQTGAFPEADYRLVFEDESARVEVRSDADPMLNAYSQFGYFPDSESEPGFWNLHRLITNHRQSLSDGTRTPVEIDPAGLLHHGVSDPNHPDFDSRSTWFAAGHTIEMRIPWQAIGFADPSSHRVFDVERDGTIDYVEIDSLPMAVAMNGEVIRTMPYAWEGWNQVSYTERIKAGMGVLAAKVIELSR